MLATRARNKPRLGYRRQWPSRWDGCAALPELESRILVSYEAMMSARRIAMRLDPGAPRESAVKIALRHQHTVERAISLRRVGQHRPVNEPWRGVPPNREVLPLAEWEARANRREQQLWTKVLPSAGSEVR